jgi:threonine synthase
MPLGSAWRGCPNCGGVLVVDYPEVGAVTSVDQLAATLTPVRPEVVIDLGQGGTPLLAAERVAPELLLKLESQNPTSSHKDRYHAITAGLASRLGASGFLTSSTGNHGASAATFAAAAGLPATIMLDRDAPLPLLARAHAHGATLAMLGDEANAAIEDLVDRGWFPSTAADPRHAGRSNPYGQEGYKAIAYELAEELGGVPPLVAVPVAGGDTLYGIWRGFRDLEERLGLAMPELLACQPAWFNTLGDGGRPGGDTLALSASGEHAGAHAECIVYREGATVQPVSEQDLTAAIELLAAAGFLVDPASGLSVAGIIAARREGRVAQGAAAVAVITAGGQPWTDRLTRLWGEAHVAKSRADLMATLSARSAG